MSKINFVVWKKNNVWAIAFFIGPIFLGVRFLTFFNATDSHCQARTQHKSPSPSHTHTIMSTAVTATHISPKKQESLKEISVNGTLPPTNKLTAHERKYLDILGDRVYAQFRRSASISAEEEISGVPELVPACCDLGCGIALPYDKYMVEKLGKCARVVSASAVVCVCDCVMPLRVFLSSPKRVNMSTQARGFSSKHDITFSHRSICMFECVWRVCAFSCLCVCVCRFCCVWC